MTSYGSIERKGSRDEDPTSVSVEATPLVRGENEHASATHDVSWWDSLTFSWFSPLLARGNSKQKLDPEDLDLLPLPAKFESTNVSRAFEKYWAEELKRAAAARTDGTSKGLLVTPSLVRSLFRAFGTDFVKAGVYKLVHDLALFVGPQVLNRLIYFLRDADAPLSQGLLLTMVVTLSQLTMSLCVRHYFFKCYITGLRIRTSVVVAVYRKALSISSGERQIRTTGEITNLMSIDAQRMQDLITYLHAVWYSFLQIGMALYFLWQQLGSSCLGGVAVIIIMIPVTRSVAKWMGFMQKKLMKSRDARVELNTEVLGSMKVIKLQAWEEPFRERINALRETELGQLFRYIVGICFSGMIWSSTPLAVALATFATYTLSGHQLEVASALTSLALFDILRFPLFMLPQVINNIVEASVSFKRVSTFLLCDEHEPVSPGGLREPGIVIENATFAYETNKVVVTGANIDSKGVELTDAKWEVALLKAQLMEAEMRIMELSNKAATKSTFEDNLLEPDHTSPPNLLCLKRLNFECSKGELIVVVGGVGCGKSSFISAILGEVKVLAGTAYAKGSMGCFSQNPFILNASVRDNILFGHVNDKFDSERYQRAISCCALTHDLEMLPAGDRTEIGEKGITLSGGQKARVAMARVVYHDADICLLDDPLAAVDAHVGKHIFQKCLIDELLLCKGSDTSAISGTPEKKKTVILVTNALQYLTSPFVDRIMVLNEGRVVEEGTYGELSTTDSTFARFLAAMKETGEVPVCGASFAEASDSSVESSSFPNLTALDKTTDEPEVARVLSPRLSVSKSHVSHETDGGDPQSRRSSRRRSSRKSFSALMTDELREREIGHVDRDVYLAWAKAAGGVWILFAFLFGYGAVESFSVLSKWWLTYWSNHGDESGTGFLKIYALINVGAITARFCQLLFVSMCGLRASRVIFTRLLDSVLHAPMWFFDTTPIGRITNRFSKDIYTVDEQLMATLKSYFSTLFTVLSTIIVISGITPVFTLCLIPIIAFYAMQQRYFTVTYRELKRLDSINRSPLYALLGETLDGVLTIRAFEAQNSLASRMLSNLDKQQHAYFLTCAAQCWLAVRLELVGTLIITFACLCSVLQHGRLGGDESFAGLAGLSISFALTVTQSLNWSVRMGSDFEANMVAVERIEQYTQLRSEAPRHTDADLGVSGAWPSKGRIDFVGVTLRYRPGLPLVLKGLDLKIPAGSKVGVVGRTGAGKSTLMVALLRIVELDTGYIHIDGVDIRTIGLSKLRSKIAVIPQDPVLFSGSVRTNLDPFDEHTDDRLYDVLSRVGLFSNAKGETSTSSLSSLAHTAVQTLADQVSEGGSNFSVGQRQLIVIARALLGGATIVIMDEATAAIDVDADARITRVMRTEFASATTITVAHRLNTIMDSDFILVMDKGCAAEFDSPRTLLERGGMFRDLVDAAARDGADES